MRLGSSKAWAKTIGSGLARVQDGIDHLAEYGFEQLKKLGSKPKKDTSKNPYIRGVKRALGTAVTFIGQLGDSYYDSYEELKRKP